MKVKILDVQYYSMFYSSAFVAENYTIFLIVYYVVCIIKLARMSLLYI